MYNLTKIICLWLIALTMTGCRKEKSDRNTDGEGPGYFYPVNTLEQYLFNIDLWGQQRNMTGFDPLEIPDLQPIPRLDSLIDAALIADSTPFDAARPPYYFKSSSSASVTIVGSTCFLEIYIVADSLKMELTGARVRYKGKPANATMFTNDTLPGINGTYRFYLQDIWDYEQRDFADNVVVYGRVRNDVITCYAMVYSEEFF